MNKELLLRILVGGLVFVALAGIVIALMIIPSPAEERVYKLDQQRVNDLQAISYAVNDYYYVNSSLPSALTDIRKGNYDPLSSMNDPETGQPYEYILNDAENGQYQLCANFNQEVTRESQAQYYVYDTKWLHPAGHFCFDLKAPKDLKY